jgi:hypothetical protein
MATSNPGAAQPTIPSGVNAGANTFPFLNVTGSLNAEIITSRQPLQIQQGSHLLSGFGAPSSAIGVNGDAYLRRDSPGGATHLYYKAAGSWTGIV